ncbi:cupin domain-containing protein [Flammeovirga pectinis]|uniref:Cupin domain-containing protein n=1 Tax=Flammeovirga pectinis TaxID=2494373 RepID=A0A3Q9FQ67_9BACT|nr:cupin domain-containing protein [Flammeovirga pectinis]AZQ62220.1 cupin domain-containing protein [Flammeovirga pectinis]
MTKSEIIQQLQLEPHPEGGFYAETYRSHKTVLLPEDKLERNVSTAIYYMLGKGDFSTFHRLKFTEIWHYYDGSPVKLVEITPEGELIETIVGKDFSKGQVPQYIIKGGNWFAGAALIDDEEGYTLIGCTVAPGFEFQDFEIADTNVLKKEYPKYSELIDRFKK